MPKTFVFFTSDTHFGHKNIINYCNRPFENANDMDQAMIQRWNYAVKNDDIIYHLGDFTFHGHELARELFSQLNGRIRMLSYPWHHDKRWLPKLMADPPTSNTGHKVIFQSPMVVMKTTINGESVPITLCHYPLFAWEQQHRGAVLLYGHSHQDVELGDRAFHVGVDTNNFRPVSLHKIRNSLIKAPSVNPYDTAPPADSKPVKSKDDLMFL